MNCDRAETIALGALGWLAGNEDLLPVFITSSGVDLADLRQRAGDPDFLASVLDFLLMDDAWVMGFCDASGINYAEPAEARQALPGGAPMNWT